MSGRPDVMWRQETVLKALAEKDKEIALLCARAEAAERALAVATRAPAPEAKRPWYRVRRQFEDLSEENKWLRSVLTTCGHLLGVTTDALTWEDKAQREWVARWVWRHDGAIEPMDPADLFEELDEARRAAEEAATERDALRARLARVEALAERWETGPTSDWPDKYGCAAELREALGEGGAHG